MKENENVRIKVPIPYGKKHRKIAKKQTFRLIAIREPIILKLLFKRQKVYNFFKIQKYYIRNRLHERHLVGNHIFCGHQITISPTDGISYGKMHTFWAKNHEIFKLIVKI